MKTLNKPASILTLTALVWYLFCAVFNNHIFSWVYVYLSQDYVQYIEAYKVPFFIAAGLVIIFFVSRFYCTNLLAIQKQYFAFFDDSPLPMTILDLESHKFVAANQAAINIYGYSEEEFTALSITNIRVETELELMHEDVKSTNERLKKAGIRHHRKKNGEIILVEVSLNQICFKNKKCLLLVANDITENVKAREEKRIADEERIKSQNFTSYVIENFPVDVAIFDKDHKYILLNKTAVKDDKTRKWMIGKDDFDYFKMKGKDLSIAEHRRERFLKAIAGESKEWIDEHIVDGKQKFMLRKFYPYTEDGKLKYVYGYGMDITQVKKAQMQRDEYIDQLEKIAFATSHKLRQPICNIQGLVGILEAEKINGEELNEIIGCIQNSVGALDNFTRDLGVKLYEYKQNLTPLENEE